MWGRLVVGTVVGCLVAWCADPGRSQPATGAPVCGPASAQTLRQDSVARVYQQNRTVYGCALPGGQPIKLGGGPYTHAPVPPGASPVALGGTIAAYGQTFHGTDFGSTSVVVRQLTDGQQLSSFPALTAPTGPESFTSVGSIVVKADGAVGWIGYGSGIFHRGRRTQVFRGQGSQTTLLDHARGHAIASGSLKLRRSRLTWTHGGKTRAARLR